MRKPLQNLRQIDLVDYTADSLSFPARSFRRF